MKANKKTVILLGVASIFTLVASTAYVLLFLAVKNKTEATASLSEKIEELSGKESRLASSVAVLRRESANIEKLSSFFFKESEVVFFTKKIEALGEQSGTILTIESLDKGFTEKTVPFLNFRIKATGEFTNIERLLILLESFPGKLEWKTLRLTRDDLPAEGNPVKPTTTAPLWKVEAFLTALNFVNE